MGNAAEKLDDLFDEDVGPWTPQTGPQADATTASYITEMLYGGAAFGGKMLDVRTPIPTPSGWTTMGALHPGDAVFDECGAVCRVVAALPVVERPHSYRVAFDDGSSVDACADHRWITIDPSTRISRPKIVTTEEIAETLLNPRGRSKHAIQVAGALRLPEAILPIPPYTLGAWLGDGTSANSDITGLDREVWEAIQADGFEVRHSKVDRLRHCVLGLKPRLRVAGVLGQKHIPAVYMRGSAMQRLHLLQGLMDTDGHACLDGSCEFDSAAREIAAGVLDLTLSLGIKARMHQRVMRLHGRIVGPAWRVVFRTDLRVFRIERKARRLRGSRRSTLRYITSCDLIDPVPMRCIAVDSPSHLYLCGRTLIPTHNTDFLLGDFLQDVPRYGAAWRGILFRKTTGELDDIIQRSRELFPRTGAFYNDGRFVWRWPNGASLRFRYLELEKHKWRYQGHAYAWIGWDELTHWASDSAYRYLRGRLRSAQQNIPTMRIRSTANPGGIGHGWVKAKFITPAPGGFKVLTDPDTGGSVVFIPSRISDNKIGLQNDPTYANRLRGLGSKALVNAMLEGDWDVIEGAYFDCWSSKQHVIRPFKIPKDWVRFRSMDWGSASPFSVGWWAVVQDDYELPDGRILPRGALVRYREWYGTRDPAVPGKGLKLSAGKVGEGIAMMEEHDPKISGGVLDPSTFKQDGGPPISEMINNELIKRKLATFRPADNTRVSTRDSKDKRGPMSGWDQMRSRMVGTAEIDESGVIDWSTGRPMVYCFDTCVASVRTIPALQHDAQKPEDLDTSSEDHAADDWRYGLNSRPYRHGEPDIDERPDAYKGPNDDNDDGGASSVKTI